MPLLVPCVDVAVCIGYLFQGIAAIDDRVLLPSLGKLTEEREIFVAGAT